MRFPSFGSPVWLAASVSALVLGCLDASTAPTETPTRAPEAQTTNGERASGRIEFTALAPGDEVAVEFKSDGCFHHFAAEVVLTREPSGLAVALRRADANVIPPRRLVAAARLDADAMHRLDRVLGFYRSDRPEGCTTVDHITLRVLSGALKGVEERYTDASCGTFEEASYYPIGALFRVVRDSARKGAA